MALLTCGVPVTSLSSYYKSERHWSDSLKVLNISGNRECLL